MSRIRIEGLLAAFPKLVGSGTGKQHTYVETENVRYVYQPIEVLHLQAAVCKLLTSQKMRNLFKLLSNGRCKLEMHHSYLQGGYQPAASNTSRATTFTWCLGHSHGNALPYCSCKTPIWGDSQHLALMLAARHNLTAQINSLIPLRKTKSDQHPTTPSLAPLSWFPQRVNIDCWSQQYAVAAAGALSVAGH